MNQTMRIGASSAPWGQAHLVLLLAAHDGRIDGQFGAYDAIVNGVPLGRPLQPHLYPFALSGGAMGAPEWRSLRRLEIMAALGLARLATYRLATSRSYASRDFPDMIAEDRAIMMDDIEAFVERDPDDLAKLRRALGVLVLEWGRYARPLTPELSARRAWFFRAFERAAERAAA